MTKVQLNYHKDHLGSSTLITNDSGNVVQRIEYLPYGEVFLGAEEYTCHFKNQWHHFLKDSSMPNKRDNENIFNYLESHPTWNKTTKYFKTALTDYKNSFK